MSEPNVNTQVRQFLEEAKSTIISLIDAIDNWLESLENLAKFLNSDVPFDKYQEFVNEIKHGLTELFNAMTYAEDRVDEAMLNTWLGKLMDLENLWGDFVLKTNYIEKAAKNVADGCIPQYTKLNIPRGWRDTKQLFGKGSSTF